MAFQDLIKAAQIYFPSLQVKYKNQSGFMKFLSKLLFFTPGFMTDYTTTLGTTIYAPNPQFFTLHPVSSSVVLLHEFVHMHDQKVVSQLAFQIAYLLPQILILPALLLFLWHWWIAIPAILLLALPLPAFFRMNSERRAYISSIYTIQKLSQLKNFDPRLANQRDAFISYFISSNYYWMWPFKNHLLNDFNQAIQDVQAGKRPYQDDQLFDMLDDLVTKV